MSSSYARGSLLGPALHGGASRGHLVSPELVAIPRTLMLRYPCPQQAAARTIRAALATGGCRSAGLTVPAVLATL